MLFAVFKTNSWQYTLYFPLLLKNLIFMNSKLIWFTIAVAFGCGLAEKMSYEGYKLYNIFPETETHIDFLSQLEHSPDVTIDGCNFKT